MSDDFLLDTDDLIRRMDGALANLRTEFASLRTGRASGSMLEPIMVDAYGSATDAGTDYGRRLWLCHADQPSGHGQRS